MGDNQLLHQLPRCCSGSSLILSSRITLGGHFLASIQGFLTSKDTSHAHQHFFISYHSSRNTEHQQGEEGDNPSADGRKKRRQNEPIVPHTSINQQHIITMADGNPPAPPARGVENRDQDDDGRDGDNNEGTGARLPPPPPPAAVSWLSSLSSSSSSQPSLTASSLQEAPGVSIEAKAAEMASLSDQERNALFEDLYGRKPESIEKVERLLLAVHGELRRISHVEKTAVLTRGLEEFPSPFHSSRHVLPFLQAEGFDPRRAARVGAAWQYFCLLSSVYVVARDTYVPCFLTMQSGRVPTSFFSYLLYVLCLLFSTHSSQFRPSPSLPPSILSLCASIATTSAHDQVLGDTRPLLRRR